MAIAISHSNSLVHVIINFSSCEKCSWKQLFVVGSTTELKRKLFEQNLSCRAPTLVQSRDRY